MIAGAIEGTVAILETLHGKGVPLYALSNWSAQTWPLAKHRFAFFGLFNGLVIYGLEGTMKPEPEIFHILRDRHGIDPSDAVFIDDNPANIAAAEALGFSGILFSDPAELSAALSDLGLL